MANESPELEDLLLRWQEDGREGLAQLTEAAYGGLRNIARGLLAGEHSGHTLQTTGLVNELFVRLAAIREHYFADPAHFFAFAARVMRAILVDHARAQRAEKRLGQRQRVPLHSDLAWVDSAGDDMLELSLALDDLEAIDARKVRVVEHCCILGCTNEETAGLLGISRATVERDLQFARAWLYRRLRPEAAPPS